jgi:hypothetical protein
LPSETWPSGRSPTTTLVDSRAPAAHVRLEGPQIASFACSRCSVLRVCHPRDGFLPHQPESAVFHADSAPGTLPLRSFLRLAVGDAFPRPLEPTYRFSFRLYHAALATRPAPEDRGFWAHARSGVLWSERRRFSPSPCRMLPWGSPSEGTPANVLPGISPGTPPACFSARRSGERREPPAPRSLDQHSPGRNQLPE